MVERIASTKRLRLASGMRIRKDASTPQPKCPTCGK